MPRSMFHSVLAWLILIWFGLSSTLLSGGLVVCRDGHGQTRVEWGCDRNGSGECKTACGTQTHDEGGDPHPCQDTTVPEVQQFTKLSPRAEGLTAVSIPVAVAAHFFGTDAPESGARAWVTTPDRPPDPLGCIRTVVLLV